jgi:hypothetical protein
MPTPALHPDKQQGGPIGQHGGAWIEDAVRGIGPIGGGQNRIQLVPVKELVMMMAH